MYIGKTPTVGNFQVCDAISVVNGQAAYTLQVGGVNVAPESANHMLVSLNGILQKPGSSFTISGSTMTFASNLATGDVIDFVQILGNVLDIGQPSDDTVKTASIQANAVTAAKLDVTSITGQTAETFIADGDTILIHDASASALRKMTKANFVAGVGGANTPAFSAKSNAATSMSANTDTKILYGAEDFDSDGTFASSRFTPGVSGKYYIEARFRFSQDNDITGLKIALFKNGSAVRVHQQSNIHYETVCISGIFDLDTDDYVEVYGTHNYSSSSSTVNDDAYNRFIGFRIIT